MILGKLEVMLLISLFGSFGISNVSIGILLHGLPSMCLTRCMVFDVYNAVENLQNWSVVSVILTSWIACKLFSFPLICPSNGRS